MNNTWVQWSDNTERSMNIYVEFNISAKNEREESWNIYEQGEHHGDCYRQIWEQVVTN